MMLTAAHDLLKPLDVGSNNLCNPLSAGTFLLADTIGGVIGIAVAPVCPMGRKGKISFITLLSTASFVITAFSYSETIALFGVLAAAFAAGFGEATIMAVSLEHEMGVICAYTSGLGAAALISSGAYLVTAYFVSTRTSLLLMTAVPFVMYFTFWFVIQNPVNSLEKKSIPNGSQTTVQVEKELANSNFEKVKMLLTVTPATLVPLFLTSVLRCFINHGLLELVHSRDVTFDSDVQYRWLNTVANMGMFFSQSSVSCLRINKLWILPCIQTLLMALILLQILMSSTHFYLIVLLSFLEGMVGGAAIVNTYYDIRMKTRVDLQPVQMEAAILANEMGAATAGFIAIPSHSAICSMISTFRSRKR